MTSSKSPDETKPMRTWIVSRSFRYFYHKKAMVSGEKLKLQNQLCFPVYAASRLIIREYQPFLDKIGLNLSPISGFAGVVGNRRDDGKRNFAAVNSWIPIRLHRCCGREWKLDGNHCSSTFSEDERRVLVNLLKKGRGWIAAGAPEKLSESLPPPICRSKNLMALKQTLHRVIAFLFQK